MSPIPRDMLDYWSQSSLATTRVFKMPFISMLASDPEGYFLWVFLVIFSVCVHEFFHAVAALWQGDRTAAERGHLTLNPLVQMGVMPIVLLLIMGISFGATPVNPARMRNRYSDALVSFAGPFSNILLFLLFCLVIAALRETGRLSNGVVIVCGTGAVLNFVLFVFNMLPVPPLDGFSVASHFFPSLANRDSEFKNAAFFIVFLVAFFSFGRLSNVGADVASFTIDFMRRLI